MSLCAVYSDLDTVDVPRGTITYRLATTQDELHILAAFSAMLRELEPLGHDVLPTEHNVDFFYDHIFLPALVKGQHGIVLAFVHDQCVGVSFFTPEVSRLQLTLGRVIAHGLWIHPDWRRQGIAREVQAMAHRQLKRLGYLQVVSTVLTTNRAGVANCKSSQHTTRGYLTIHNLEKD